MKTLNEIATVKQTTNSNYCTNTLIDFSKNQKQRNKKMPVSLDIKKYCVAIVSFLHLLAFSQTVAVPDAYDVKSLLSPNALQEIADCKAQLPPEFAQAHIEKIKMKDEVALKGGVFAKFGSNYYMVFQKDAWACLQVSANGFPILPVSVMTKTIGTTGANPANLRNWRIGMLAELAQTGVSKGLILTNKKKAYSIEYRLLKNNPSILFYREEELPSGQVSVADYRHVISDASIQGISTTKWQSTHPISARPIHDDSILRISPNSNGFLPLYSPVQLRNAEVVPHVWRFETLQERHITQEILLESDGRAILKSGMANEVGVWRIESNALEIKFGSNSFYSLVFDTDKRFLNLTTRRLSSEHSNLPAHIREGMPTSDDYDPESRFSGQRLYRSGDLEAEKMIIAKQSLNRQSDLQKHRELLARIETRKQSILIETPEYELMEVKRQKSTNENAQQWKLCTESEIADLVYKAIQSGNPLEGFNQVARTCHSWVGSRKEWKETILKFGCNGRCKPVGF
jgi:hypothetical protein